MQVAEKDFVAAAEVANEVARVCLEWNGIDQADAWYRRGYDVALRVSGPDGCAERPVRVPAGSTRRRAWLRGAAGRPRTPPPRDRQADSRQGTNQEPAPFSLLAGCVDFYTGDAETALAALRRANRIDPFILALMAQAHERLERESGGDGAIPQDPDHHVA